MESQQAQQFIDALAKCETERDPSTLVSLFSDDCEISNVAIRPLHGRDGTERFWRDYLANFKQVRTEFTRTEIAGSRAFLEWRSTGTLESGREVYYEGLTVLEFEKDRVRSMKAYHDSAVFLATGGKHVDRIPSTSTESAEVMGGLRREISTPSEGVLTSTDTDRDAATS